MSLLSPPTQIRSTHQRRLALIYVRQSTLMQVRYHTGSTKRQYDLVQRALDLGFERDRVQVIDQDQGLSGAVADNRDGFQFLVAQVGLGRVGAVFCLEASRLARCCSDWYRLLELCALTDTLVIDEDGVYDPGQYNDRLLLGFKGTMSEAELHWLRLRLQGGLLEKARQGTLRLLLPTGFVYDPAGQIVLDPDEAVQAAIRMAFDRFEQLGSALAVVRYFREQQLLFPTRRRERTHQGELVWRPLYLSRMMELLHHPAYAGAYSYGRAWERPRRRASGDGSQALARRSCPQEPILQREAHPGYITWEQYQRNQERLDDNRSRPASGQRGAVREGRALLQGIVLCGRCGRRMSVRYVSDGATPAYVCERQHAQYGGKSCQWVHGVGVDATVAQALLEAIQPAQLEVSLAALEQIEARERQVEQQWQLRLERAQYEADLARRRFVAVEPENRLVARSLEKEWNEKLAEVARLEKAAAERPSGWQGRPSPEERERILALASDLPLVWQAATTTPAERKRLLRLLVADVTLTGSEKTVHLGIRWQTGAVTEAEVVRPKKLWEQYATDPAVIERIRALAPTHSDREIAASLNEAGMASAFGRPYSRQLVAWLRRNAGIAPGCREAMRGSGQGIRADGRMSVRRAAQELNCHASTVITWCQQGKLDGIQEHPHAVWWVRLTPEKASELRKPDRGAATERREEGNGDRE